MPRSSFLMRVMVPLLCLACFLVPAPVRSADSPYFPATGPAARHQAILDLKNPQVVMSVAAEPGEEDLGTLAALRLGNGARVFSVFVTDGGSTPSDEDGSLPLETGARRKFEAERATRTIGGEALFLGFPDYGLVSSRSRLEKFWNRDSLLNRLVIVIRTCRPDVILLARDMRAAGGDTVRSSVIREFLQRAAAASGMHLIVVGFNSGPWPVPRMFEEATPGSPGLTVDAEGIHPVWKKSYRGIGEEAAGAYRSLRVRSRNWSAGRTRMYTALPGGNGASGKFFDGLPAVPLMLKDVAGSVWQAAMDAGGARDETALRSIAQAIARIERTIAARRNDLGSLEKRLLLGWKDRLEDLRCTLLGIDIRFTVSDTVISPRELFHLWFPPDRKWPGKGRAEIIFPSAVDSTWLINRTEGFRFSFTMPDTIELISPDDMKSNRPVATNGSDKMSINTRIPFVVVHRDPDPLRNFACRREMVFGIAPVQTAEILTPVVRVTQGERLVVRLENVSGDPYRGSMSVGDSIVRPVSVPVNLSRKNFAVTDTVPLAWNDGVGEGDHSVALRIGKGPPVGTFTARKFTAQTDSVGGGAGLITGLTGSPVEEAFRRLHIPCRLLDAASFDDPTLPGLRKIFVDREAFALRGDAGRLASALGEWVRSGGHCVMLRQSHPPKGRNPLIGEAEFGAEHPIAPEAQVAPDPSSRLLSSPNVLSAGDWEDWIISRAQCSLRFGGDMKPEIHLRDASTGVPLIATLHVGKGRLTLVALDILPQLQILHPGGYRLLANLAAF